MANGSRPFTRAARVDRDATTGHATVDLTAPVALQTPIADRDRLQRAIGNQAMQRLLLTQEQGQLPRLGNAMPMVADDTRSRETRGQDTQLQDAAPRDPTRRRVAGSARGPASRGSREDGTAQGPSAQTDANAGSGDTGVGENAQGHTGKFPASRESPSDGAAGSTSAAAQTLPNTGAAPAHVAPQVTPDPSAGSISGQMASAARSLPHPSAGDFTPAQAAIRARGFQMARATAPASAATGRDGGASVSAPRVAVHHEPSEPDPVPEFTRMLRAKCNLRLPDVTPPALVASPLGHMPQMGKHPASADDLHILITGHSDDFFEQLTGEDQALIARDRERLDALRADLTGTAQTPTPTTATQTSGQSAPSAPTTDAPRVEPIRDLGAPPAPRFEEPGRGKDDMAKVFARLLADTDATATSVLTDIRRAARANGSLIGPVLNQLYPTLGEAEHKAALKTALETRINALAHDAGIATADLTAQVAQRRQELQEQRDAATASVHTAAQDAGQTIQGQAQQTVNATTTTQHAAARTAQRTRQVAPRVRLSMDVPSRRDRLLAEVTRIVTEQVTQYHQQGDIRKALLDQAERDERDAYQFAGQQDELQIHTQAGDDAGSFLTGARAQVSRDWVDTQIRQLHDTITAMKHDADVAIERFQSDVREAGDERREAIRAWADLRTGHQRTDEERAQQHVQDHADQQAKEAEAWATVQNQRTLQGVQRDFDVVHNIEHDVQQGLDRDTIISQRHLGTDQVAILDAFLGSSATGESRVLDAMVVGIDQRLAHEKEEEIAPHMADYLLAQHADEWRNLQRIGTEQTSGFNAAELANKVHTAVDRIGTDEDAIYDALANLTPIQSRAIRGAYQEMFDTSIDDDLEGDLSGRELERAQALMNADQTRADVMALRQAMKGNWEGYDLGITGIGTDDDTIHSVMRGKTAEQRQAIRDQYRALFGTDLADDVHDEFEEEHSRQRFDAELSGNYALADAIELRDLMPSEDDRQQGRGPYQADRDKIEVVYTRIRNEVTAQADHEHWTTSQMQAEIARRNHEVETIFNQQFGSDYPASDQGAFRSAVTTSFQWQPQDGNLITALADNNMAHADAARIQIEHQGVYASDSTENQVLQSQYQRAYDDLRRDDMPLHRMLMARQMADAERRTGPWTGARYWEERERRQRQIDRTLERAARGQAEGNMNALREAYEHDYPGDSFDDVIDSDTSGYSNREAMTRLRQGGYLTPAQEVFYSIRGAGTNQEMLNHALQGRTREELDQMRAEFRDLAIADNQTWLGTFNGMFDDPEIDNTNMDTEIAGDLSGRTGFDMAQLLKGTPETIEEQRQRLMEALAYENDTGVIGNMLASSERASLQTSIDTLDDDIRRLNDPTLSREARDIYVGFFDQDVRTVNAGIEAHRASLDSIVDKVTTAIGLVVAVVAGTIITVLTGGAGGVVLGAVIGSILATASTMATKQLILGQQYGWEDIGTDIAVGIADALFAALTAGIGEKLLGLGQVGEEVAEQAALRSGRLVTQQGFRGAAARFFVEGSGRFLNPTESVLARAIPTVSALKEMVERGGVSRLLATVIAEGGENMIQSSGSSLMSNLLNDRNWEHGNPLGNIVSGTLQQSATSAAVGLAFKGVHSAASGASEHLGRQFAELREPSNVLREHWSDFHQRNPEVSFGEYLNLREAARVQEQLRVAAVQGEVPSARDTAAEGTRSRGEAQAAAPQSAEQRPFADHPTVEVETRTSGETPDTATAHETARPITESDLRAGLPERFRESVPISIDPSLTGNTVKVEYTRRWGAVTDVHIVAGPHARPIDILLHAPTVQAMRRYTGISGRVVQLLERIHFWVTRNGVPPVGSRAWEAHLELSKLPLIIEERLEALRTGALDPDARAEIIADIEHLSAQVDQHQATLDRMELSPGEGFVAARGRDTTVDRDRQPPVVEERPRSRSARADPDVVRYRASDSPLEDRFGDGSVFQIGPSWKEEGRTYRVVEVHDENGRVVAVREEIRMLDERGREIDQWVQRGSESTAGGAVAEQASQLMTAAGVTTPEGARDLALPVEKIQSGSGAGFDQVIVRFHEDGSVRIILVEVKNYPGRYVPFGDFTAIGENLSANLAHLQSLLESSVRAKELGLVGRDRTRALAALNALQLEVEVRTTPDTLLGEGHYDWNVLAKLREQIRTTLGADVPVSHEEIESAYMKQAQKAVRARDRIGSTPHFYDLAGGDSGAFTACEVRQAQAAVIAERASNGIVKSPLERLATSDDTFIDRDRNRLIAVSPGTPRGAKDVQALADDIVQRLRDTTTRPRGAKEPTKVLLDVTDLTLAQRQALQEQLARRATTTGTKGALDRLFTVDVTKDEVRQFILSAKGK